MQFLYVSEANVERRIVIARSAHEKKQRATFRAHAVLMPLKDSGSTSSPLSNASVLEASKVLCFTLCTESGLRLMVKGII